MTQIAIGVTKLTPPDGVISIQVGVLLNRGCGGLRREKHLRGQDVGRKRLWEAGRWVRMAWKIESSRLTFKSGKFKSLKFNGKT
jgi:hypothetical protein